MSRHLPCFALLLTIGLLSGCSTSSNQQNHQASQQLVSLDKPNAIHHQPAMLRGRVIIGPESSSLTPCNSQGQYLLILDKKQSQQLTKQIHYPYQELYVELSGLLEAPSQTGFNADYQARVLVQNIDTISQDSVFGCAQPVKSSNATHWIADYYAQSQKNEGLQIHLHLDESHQAMTEYRYLNSADIIIERGFWQVLNDQQIEVTMTQYQQQYLVTKRIFTRDGNRLTTSQEQVGAKIYPIRDGGLTLFKAE